MACFCYKTLLGGREGWEEDASSQILVLELWSTTTAILTDKRTSFMQSGEIILNHPDERALGLHLLRFSDVILYTSILPTLAAVLAT